MEVAVQMAVLRAQRAAAEREGTQEVVGLVVEVVVTQSTRHSPCRRGTQCT